MSEKPWASIADLFSGTLMVFIVLTVILMIVPKFHEQNRISTKLIKLASNIDKQKNIIEVDINNSKVILRDAFFETASACISNSGKDAIPYISNLIVDILTKNKKTLILIEGHADSRPVNRTINSCGFYFSDNMQLSTARSISIRNEIIKYITTNYDNGSTLVEQIGENIGAAGYGDLKPVDKKNPENPLNRRVEIRIINVD